MLNEIYNFETWINTVEPLPGESISHFLGRFERANLLTGYQIGKEAGVGAIVTRWKKLYLNPFPTQQELEGLAKFVEVEVEKITQTLPLKGITMKPRPIKLCAACYAEQPCHRIEWQYKEKVKCDRHQLGLLTKCTNCETPFPIPADWELGECTHCSLPFAKMVKRQKRY
ncbi:MULTISPECIES: TniQ family protein [Nostoc]|uniref:TniQ family protein n=2 Tax=Nostoc TaxID=1177 RepID=A0ABR8IBX3_9NOSO|nr:MULTISPECIES: TniQ family protein [Nostoc]MBD2560254.1 TniQ family protein [Nostoc linckia FACHB-391]MBD2648764.1 TniQ family protein [Nostoc foliaceum FACHB-393]